MAYLARATVPLRVLLAAAVLAALLGAALSHLPAGERSAWPSAPHAQVTARNGLERLPVSAQGPVSAALGAERPAYRVSAAAVDTPWALNPAQRLQMRFERSGAVVSSGSLQVGLGLRALGYGRARNDAGAAAPQVRANRVSYARAGLSEWYRNGPLGLEQGFTIERAPTTRAGGPLTLSLALSGNANASLTPGARSVTLSHGGTSLHYGGLTATDARGHLLRSWMAVESGTIVLRVETRGARYPVRIDPLLQQGGRLTPDSEVGSSEAGTSVAISADGNTALIGGIGDEPKGGPMEGAAWVFTRSGATWTQQAKLTGADELGEAQFGISVALSADGNTALIGGINDEAAPGKQFGAAWVFTRSGSAWSQQGAKLNGGAEEMEGGRFGKSVALSADGNTALIGAYFDATHHGSAFVFTRSGSTWSRTTPRLLPTDETGEGQFGLSVALSSDGNTALIGGPNDEGSKPVAMTGAAWVFTRSGSTWTQQTKLAGAGEQGAGELGAGVALSADGNTALAGAPGDGDAGAAWAFTRSGTAWSQQAKLAPSDATSGAAFGAGVALSDDGNTALIGGPVDKPGAVPSGAAWEFARSGSTWTQQGAKLQGAGEVPESEFGAADALSGDGRTALVGGPIDHGNVGAAWVFVNQPAPNPATTAATGSSATSVPVGAAVRPVIANASQSHRSWREGGALAKLSTKTKKLTAPLGTTFSFTLNEPASVSFAFARQLSGRRVKGRCVAPGNANRRRHACKRAVPAGTLSFAAHAGANRLSFQGAISHSKKLKPGSYTLLISATSAGLRAVAGALSFTIVK